MLRNKYALNGVTLPPIISDLDKSALLNKLTSLDKDELNSLDADYLKNINKDVLNSLDADFYKSLNKGVLKSLDADFYKGIDKSILNALGADFFLDFPDIIIQSLPLSFQKQITTLKNPLPSVTWKPTINATITARTDNKITALANFNYNNFEKFSELSPKMKDEIFDILQSQLDKYILINRSIDGYTNQISSILNSSEMQKLLNKRVALNKFDFEKKLIGYNFKYLSDISKGEIINKVKLKLDLVFPKPNEYDKAIENILEKDEEIQKLLRKEVAKKSISIDETVAKIDQLNPDLLTNTKEIAKLINNQAAENVAFNNLLKTSTDIKEAVESEVTKLTSVLPIVADNSSHLISRGLKKVDETTIKGTKPGEKVIIFRTEQIKINAEKRELNRQLKRQQQLETIPEETPEDVALEIKTYDNKLLYDFGKDLIDQFRTKYPTSTVNQRNLKLFTQNIELSYTVKTNIQQKAIELAAEILDTGLNKSSNLVESIVADAVGDDIKTGITKAVDSILTETNSQTNKDRIVGEISDDIIHIVGVEPTGNTEFDNALYKAKQTATDMADGNLNSDCFKKVYGKFDEISRATTAESVQKNAEKKESTLRTISSNIKKGMDKKTIIALFTGAGITIGIEELIRVAQQSVDSKTNTKFQITNITNDLYNNNMVIVTYAPGNAICQNDTVTFNNLSPSPSQLQGKSFDVINLLSDSQFRIKVGSKIPVDVSKGDMKVTGDVGMNVKCQIDSTLGVNPSFDNTNTSSWLMWFIMCIIICALYFLYSWSSSKKTYIK